MTTQFRSRAAQEKIADQHMALSTKLISFSLYGTLAVPLGLVVAAFFGPEPGLPSIIEIMSRVGDGTIFGFVILFLAPLILAGYTRKVALDIYDRVSLIERLKHL